jgi:hypothetical protein
MDLSALSSEDKVQLSDSEEQDSEVSNLDNEDLGSDHESHEDEDFQELDYDDDDEEADYEGVETAGSALPNAFDRLRVSDRRSFNSVNFSIIINHQQVPLTLRQTISKLHQLVMQRQAPTTILRSDKDEHLLNTSGNAEKH